MRRWPKISQCSISFFLKYNIMYLYSRGIIVAVRAIKELKTHNETCQTKCWKQPHLDLFVNTFKTTRIDVSLHRNDQFSCLFLFYWINLHNGNAWLCCRWVVIDDIKTRERERVRRTQYETMLVISYLKYKYLFSHSIHNESSSWSSTQKWFCI